MEKISETITAIRFVSEDDIDLIESVAHEDGDPLMRLKIYIGQIFKNKSRNRQMINFEITTSVETLLSVKGRYIAGESVYRMRDRPESVNILLGRRTMGRKEKTGLRKVIVKMEIIEDGYEVEA